MCPTYADNGTGEETFLYSGNQVGDPSRKNGRPNRTHMVVLRIDVKN